MKKSYNKAFTLVELLAVIVILAIILVIAVPKIMDVINSSKKSTLETSVKMIASSAEKTKMQNTVLGKEDAPITCDSVAKLSASDYDLDNCIIKFDGNTAKVTIKGKGKFEGLSVCGGTKNNATAQTGACATPKEYFTYGLYALNLSDITVEDVDKCANYTNSSTSNCGLYQYKDACENKEWGLKYAVPTNKYVDAGLKLSDNAEVGIIITNYNLEGGTEVVIPSTIDGYKVVGVKLLGNKFNGITKLTVPDTVKEEHSYYYDPETSDYYGNNHDSAFFVGCPPPS